MSVDSSLVFRYQWHAQNQSGSQVSGVLYGRDKNNIREQLAQRGLIAQRIILTREPLRRSVSEIEATRFLQELSTLYDAGVPLLRVFNVLLHSQKNSHFREVIQTLSLDVERGESLSLSMRHHPRVFDSLTCNLVESGEASGKLSEVLKNIVYSSERSQQLKSQMLTAMIYPVFIVIVTLLVWTAVLGWVVPVFEGIYKNGGKHLPWLTQLLLDASRILRSQGGWLILFFVLVAIFLIRWKNVRWLYFLDVLKLKLPIFDRLFKAALHAQFTRTFGLLYESGVPLHESLLISARTVRNLPMRTALLECRQDVLNGLGLSAAMARHSMFDPSLVQRMQIGEESGALAALLAQYALQQEFLVEQLAQRLASLLEPLLVLFIGGMVAVMVIALYLPILNLGSTL